MISELHVMMYDVYDVCDVYIHHSIYIHHTLYIQHILYLQDTHYTICMFQIVSHVTIHIDHIASYWMDIKS